MSSAQRLALVDREDSALSVAAQCRLLKVGRSTLYYQPVPMDPDDLVLMRRMDELYTASPFYGSRRMVAVLRRDGWTVNRKRVRRDCLKIGGAGVEAVVSRPFLSWGSSRGLDCEIGENRGRR